MVFSKKYKYPTVKKARKHNTNKTFMNKCERTLK